MITLARVGDVIRFTFQDNPLYLNNGTIEVPVNSLSLLIDESNIATFKKAASNDIFLSCSLDELGMTRTQLINWYKDNMVDEGITPEEVEDIVESATTNLFGYAEYDSQNTRINFKHDASGSVISSIDASDFVIDGMIDNVEIVTVEGVKYLKITFNTESGKEPILIPLADIFNPDNYYTKTATDALLAEKANTATTYTKTEVDNAISAATSGKADTSAVTEAIDAIDAAYKAADAVISGAVDSVSGDVATEAQRAISAETALDSKIDTVSGNVVTSGEIESMIEEAVSGKVDTDVFDEKERVISAALNDLNTRKLDASAYTPTDLSNYYTKSETDGEIEEAVSGKADTSAFTAHTADTNVHVTLTEKTTWNAKSDFSGSYNDLSDKPTIPVVPTNVSAFNNDSGYITSNAISGKADTSAVTEAISAAVSGKADSDSVYTKTEVDNAITSATSTKQDTLVAGRGISITTAETADTISFNLPISAGTGADSVVEGYSTIASGDNSHAEGLMTQAIGTYSHAEGSQTQAKSTCSHAEGLFTSAATPYSFACGLNGVASGDSLTVSDTNTIFAIGNGLDNTHRTTNPHNAFEVKLNGDIYIADTNDTSTSQYYRKPMIKLQDALGGGSSYTAGDGIDITNDVISVTGKADSNTVYTKTEVDSALSGKQDTLVAGTNITISGNVISAEGGGVDVVQTTGTSTTDVMSQDAVTTAINTVSGAIPTTYISSIQEDSSGGWTRFVRFSTPSNINYWILDNPKINGKQIHKFTGIESNINQFSLVETSAITTSMTSGSTDSQVPSAKAVYDKLGGLSLVKLTQAEYDALETIDNSTLYIIVDGEVCAPE